MLAPLDLQDPSAVTLGWGRTLMFGVPAALLIHGLVCLELEKGFGRFIPNLAVSIGDWSYALYLCHILVLSAVARLYFPIIGNFETSIWDNVGFLILASVVAIIVSWITYELIERPIIKWYQEMRTRLFGKARPV